MEIRLGLIVSHNASTAEAILRAIKKGKLDAYANVIISASASAEILDISDKYNIAFLFMNKENYPAEYKSFDEAIAMTMIKHGVNLIFLSGYAEKIESNTLEAYKNRIISVHPSLLPKHSDRGMFGMKVHEAVIASEDEESGASVHLVNEEYGKGRILAQEKVPRHQRDTAQALAERVKSIEHDLCIRALKEIREGKIMLD